MFLYHRVEQIFGIRAEGEALKKLDARVESICGHSFVENPAAYEHALSSQENVFDIAQEVTINETYFFREGAHFELLMRSHLPRLAKLGRPIRFCSAASSIGCEAYSLAMLLSHYSKTQTQFEFEIDAFDVCAPTIEVARGARYSSNSIRPDGSGWKGLMDDYLTRDGNEFVVSKDIRSSVRFFAHNIMNGIEKRYDVIFFRNALIYFSAKSRQLALDDLAEALLDDGILFLGVSETSSADHPLLASRRDDGVFYFQKPGRERFANPSQAESAPPAHPPRAGAARPMPEIGARAPRESELPVDCAKVAALLEKSEGRDGAAQTLAAIANERNSQFLSGADLASAAVYFISAQDFSCAGRAISFLEERNSGAIPPFLRGECHMLNEKFQEAAACFEKSISRGKDFWPAFYRLALLPLEGDGIGQERMARLALESLGLGARSGYECFLGGFSTDYFKIILERKLMNKA